VTGAYIPAPEDEAEQADSREVSGTRRRKHTISRSKRNSRRSGIGPRRNRTQKMDTVYLPRANRTWQPPPWRRVLRGTQTTSRFVISTSWHSCRPETGPESSAPVRIGCKD
jgi:hypothetical protein